MEGLHGPDQQAVGESLMVDPAVEFGLKPEFYCYQPFAGSRPSLE
jgi:hypothetical protein